MKKKLMLCWVGRKTKLLIAILLIFLAGIVPFQGCVGPVTTPPKPIGVEELGIKTIYFDNPDNPIVCAAGSEEEKGELLAVLGEKNPDGTPKEINAILYGAESGQSIFMLLGSNKLPLMAIDSGGLVIEYKDYVGSKARAYIYDQEGNLIHEPVDVDFGDALATEGMNVFSPSRYRQIRGDLIEELAQIALDSLATASKYASYAFCTGTIIGAIASWGVGTTVALFACASPFLDFVAYALRETGDSTLSEFVSESSIALDCIKAIELFQAYPDPIAALDFISCINGITDFLREEIQTAPTPTSTPDTVCPEVVSTEVETMVYYEETGGVLDLNIIITFNEEIYDYGCIEGTEATVCVSCVENPANWTITVDDDDPDEDLDDHIERFIEDIYLNGEVVTVKVKITGLKGEPPAKMPLAWELNENCIISDVAGNKSSAYSGSAIITLF